MTAANLINGAAARATSAVPVAFVDERTLLVAMADPANVLAVDDIALMTGYEVRVAVASREDIAHARHAPDAPGRRRRLHRASRTRRRQGPAEVVDLRESADDAPVIKLVHQIIAQAVEEGASRHPLRPRRQQLRVRFRIDGVLQETTTVPRRDGQRRHLAA